MKLFSGKDKPKLGDFRLVERASTGIDGPPYYYTIERLRWYVDIYDTWKGWEEVEKESDKEIALLKLAKYRALPTGERVIA
jgi:hypothetical protein